MYDDAIHSKQSKHAPQLFSKLFKDLFKSRGQYWYQITWKMQFLIDDIFFHFCRADGSGDDWESGGEAEGSDKSDEDVQ